MTSTSTLSGRLRNVLLPVLGVVSIAAVWFAITDVLDLTTSTILPSPIRVYEHFMDVYPIIFENLVFTLRAGLLGFLGAIVLATLVAILVNVSERARVTLMPYLVAGNTIPRIAIAPLIIFYVDVYAYANLIIAAWVAFFPIFLNIRDGLRNVDEDRLMYFDFMGATTLQTYRYLRFPSAVPYVFDAMKIGIVAALVGAVVGEFVASSEGIGYLALLGLMRNNVPLALAIIFVVGLITTALVYLVYLAEERLVFWKDANLFT